MKTKKILAMEDSKSGKIKNVKREIPTEDIVEKKATRMFAPFRNSKEMNERMEDLLEKIPKRYKSDLWLWIGQYESTWIEGFSDNNNGRK